MKTRICKECHRQLKLDSSNFRRFKGKYRYTCRYCVNARRRRLYHLQKEDQPCSKHDPEQLARRKRLQAHIEKYESAQRILRSYGLSVDAPAAVADAVLANALRPASKSA